MSSLEEKPKMNWKKRIAIILFVLLNVAVILITLFSEIDKDGIEAIRLSNVKINPAFLCGAFGCFVFAIAAETLKYFLLIKNTGSTKSMKLAYETAVYGRYYDCITPSGIGGQPYQIYHLKKSGLSASVAGAVPIMGFIGMQFGFVFLSAISMAFGFKYMTGPGMIVAECIGFICYVALPLCIMVFTWNYSFAQKVGAFFIRLFAKMKIVKDPDATTEKLHRVLDQYSTIFKDLMHRKLLTVAVLGLSMLYHFLVCCMPYFVIHAFGGTFGFMQSFVTTIAIYTAITFIPTPGNSGAAEGSFYLVFSSLSDNIPTFYPMIIWRLFSYYSFVLLGALSYLVTFISNRIKSRKEKHAD